MRTFITRLQGAGLGASRIIVAAEVTRLNHPEILTEPMEEVRASSHAPSAVMLRRAGRLLLFKPAQRLALGLLCIALLSSGCATQTLWSKNDSGPHKPADQPYLYLYRPRKQNDILVVYDDVRERDRMLIRRAYFLIPNLPLVEAGRRPHFAGKSKYVGMEIIPLIEGTSAIDMWMMISGVYATSTNHGQQFTLHIDGSEMGPYSLPVYEYRDVGRHVRRALLTPWAAATDAATPPALAAAVAALVAALAGANGATYSH